MRVSRGIGLLRQMCKMRCIPRIRFWKLYFPQEKVGSPQKGKEWGRNEYGWNYRRMKPCILSRYLLGERQNLLQKHMTCRDSYRFRHVRYVRH